MYVVANLTMNTSWWDPSFTSSTILFHGPWLQLSAEFVNQETVCDETAILSYLRHSLVLLDHRLTFNQGRTSPSIESLFLTSNLSFAACKMLFFAVLFYFFRASPLSLSAGATWLPKLREAQARLPAKRSSMSPI